MTDHVKQVEEFHRVNGVHTNTSPSTKMPSMDPARLRPILLQEELDELKDAIEKHDIVEIADALADLQYLLNGSVLTFGLQSVWDAVQNEVHASNMSKLGPDGKPVIRESDGKVLKGPNYFRPNIAGILGRCPVCNGMGKGKMVNLSFVPLADGHTWCPICKGTGKRLPQASPDELAHPGCD